MNYFHIYADTPDQFSIVAGHQKLLMRVKEYVSRKGPKYFLKLSKSDSVLDDSDPPYCSTESVSNYQDYSEFPHSQNSHSVFRESSGIKQEYGNDQMVYEEDDDGGGEYTVVVQDKLVKIGSIAKARAKLTEIANRWLHNFSKLKNIPIDKIETAKVSYHQTRGFLGMIPCNQCQHFIRISTQTLPNGSTRWITSNFTKHYMRHFEKNHKNSPAGDSFDGKFDDHPAVSFGSNLM
jgi:transposase-like protein